VFPSVEPIIFQSVTAIIVIPTHEGFAIAADRRRTLAIDGSFKDDVTKIVPVDGTKVVFAASGSVMLNRSETSSELAFDFRDAIAKAVQMVRPSDPFSLRKCVRLSCEHVVSDLAQATATGGVEPYPVGSSPSDPNLIAQAVFAGYHKGVPSLVRATFRHAGQQLVAPEVVNMPLLFGAMSGYASQPIVNLINAGNGVAAAFADGIEANERTLNDAVRFAGNYFRACYDPEIRRLDEDHCRMVSSDFDLVAITPIDGVRWVVGPGT